MKHFLEVDSVILEFGNKRVLQDIYLKSEAEKVTGILGRNGSGKTCLMNIIYGELNVVNKSVRIDGKVLLEGNSNPEIMRYLPQFNFIPKSLKIKRIFKDFDLSFSEFTENFPEFEKYYNQKLRNLSGGEIRIVEIFSILASKTKFCLLDEPFSQVMPVHVNTLKDIIKSEKKNKGIIVTDHLYEHVIDVCDEIYVLVNGKTYLTRDLNDLKKLGYLSEKMTVGD